MWRPLTWVDPKPAKSANCVERQNGTILQKKSEFQSVAARFNFSAMDRPALLYSVKELMRKMASARTQDLTPLKSVARYTIKNPRMTCRYPWTELASKIEVFGDANFAGCNSTRNSTVGGVKMCSEHRDAWTKAVKRTVMNGQN